MTDALRAGDRVWRIGERSGAVRCTYLRDLPGGMALVRGSQLCPAERTVNADDVFTDRHACCAEIQRRASETKEPTS